MTSTTKSVLIEVGEEAAGVLVQGERGFTLHAVHPKLTHLHGVVYRSVQAAQAAAQAAMKDLARAG